MREKGVDWRCSKLWT